MKKIKFLSLVLCLAGAANIMGMTIDNTGNCAIVISEKASETEQFAAQEMAKYLTKISGGKFAVTTDVNAPAPRIMIGASLFPAEASQLTYDSFKIHISGDEMQLFGESAEGRGNLYAVYTLLEKIGCRFYTHTVEKIPALSAITLEDCDELHQPAYPDVRFVISWQANGWNHNWDSKLKLNGVGWGNDVPAKYGRAVEYRPYPYHTMPFLIPVKDYFETHPEYFALNNGQRIRDSYCLHNPGLIKATVDACLKFLEKRYCPTLVMCIGLPDNMYHCQCKDCAAMAKEEGSPVANNIFFTNAVAREVRKHYPDLQFQLAAYQYTRVPPKNIKTEPGVHMRIANIEGDFIGDLDSEKNNRRFKNEVIEWAKHTEKMVYVDYGSIFGNLLLPTPNLDILPKRFAQLQKLGITGIHTINQGNIGSEFSLLRNYVTAKLMWDPRQDVWELVADFCNGYYGAAGPIICEYLRYYHDLAKTKGSIIYYETRRSDFHDDELVAKGKQYFQQARAAVAGDKTLTERVEIAEMSIRFTELFLHQTEIAGSPELIAAAKEFKRLCQKYQIKYSGENSIMPDFDNVIEKPAFCKNLKSDEWMAVASEWWGMNQWVFREKDPVSNKEAIRMVTDHNAWAIFKPMIFLNYPVRKKWDVYVYVRVVPGPEATRDSIAFQRGVWVRDGVAPRGQTYLAETSEKEYRYIKVGENIAPEEKTSAWLAPLNNQEEISAIWVDHFLFVESGKAVLENNAFSEHFKSVPPENIQVLSPGYYFENQKVFHEFDRDLSRNVLRVVTNCSDWVVQTRLQPAAVKGKKWDLYVSIKVEPGAQAASKSIAFNSGCIVSANDTHRRDVLLNETSANEYKIIQIGKNLPLSEKSTMFLAPKNNPQEIKNIWIDKVIMIQKD